MPEPGELDISAGSIQCNVDATAQFTACASGRAPDAAPAAPENRLDALRNIGKIDPQTPGLKQQPAFAPSFITGVRG